MERKDWLMFGLGVWSAIMNTIWIVYNIRKDKTAKAKRPVKKHKHKR